MTAQVEFHASAICPMCSKFVPNVESDESVSTFVADDIDFRRPALYCVCHAGECERRLVDLVRGKMPFCDLLRFSETPYPVLKREIVRLVQGRSRGLDSDDGWKAKYQ